MENASAWFLLARNLTPHLIVKNKINAEQYQMQEHITNLKMTVFSPLSFCGTWAGEQLRSSYC
jgi:hypothetical protein